MLIPYRCHDQSEWHRVLTHAFVHADWMHLAFNMFVLYEFGNTVERDLGHMGWFGLPFLYVAGIVGGAIPALGKHKSNRNYRSLGASGAVSAVLMSFILLHPPDTTLLLFLVIPSPGSLGWGAVFGMKAAWSASDQVGALPTMLTSAVHWSESFGQSLPNPRP